MALWVFEFPTDGRKVQKIPENLADMTRELLINRPAHIEIKTVAQAVEVSPQWLRMFAKDKIPDPSVNRLIRLHNWLIENRHVI